MSSYQLTDAQRAQYFREGYVVIERLFDAADLARVDDTIREMTDRAIASGGDAKVMEFEPQACDGRRVCRRIYHPFEQHEAFRALAEDARMLDRVESLIGRDINLQHSKLNMKPARVGSVVEWHQDLAYFPHTNDSLVTTLVYLDDATEENGCLQVLPRHHTHYFSHARPDGLFAGMITEAIDDGRFGRPVSLTAPAGSVIFMHCITPHASLPNRSDHPRRTLIYEYRASDSFPIFFAHMNVAAQPKPRQLRGRPATHARLGGPAPLMTPRALMSTSLYELQAVSRGEIARGAAAPPDDAAARGSTEKIGS
jgi:ectoine hydroxylase-related dioxygenase (phytanoyl-CoA dioxygenase family)